MTERIIDLGGPEGGRYWRVLTDHAVDHPDAQAAAVHAAMTGSVGCTYNDAQVERASLPGVDVDQRERELATAARRRQDDGTGDYVTNPPQTPSGYMLGVRGVELLAQSSLEASQRRRARRRGMTWRDHVLAALLAVVLLAIAYGLVLLASELAEHVRR